MNALFLCVIKHLHATVRMNARSSSRGSRVTASPSSSSRSPPPPPSSARREWIKSATVSPKSASAARRRRPPRPSSGSLLLGENGHERRNVLGLHLGVHDRLANLVGRAVLPDGTRPRMDDGGWETSATRATATARTAAGRKRTRDGRRRDSRGGRSRVVATRARARDRAEARGRATAARRFRPRVSFSGLRVLASGGSSRDDDDAHLLRAVLRVPLRGLVLRVHRGADDETRGGADD